MGLSLLNLLRASSSSKSLSSSSSELVGRGGQPGKSGGFMGEDPPLDSVADVALGPSRRPGERPRSLPEATSWISSEVEASLRSSSFVVVEVILKACFCLDLGESTSAREMLEPPPEDDALDEELREMRLTPPRSEREYSPMEVVLRSRSTIFVTFRQSSQAGKSGPNITSKQRQRTVGELFCRELLVAVLIQNFEQIFRTFYTHLDSCKNGLHVWGLELRPEGIQFDRAQMVLV
eukprot:CAMPEP_0206519440 /NCGR_PEP_ID=MMETSP0324_2-20121206/65195_1 /ASSEMBLY_ACC=CAM_ASM_000836 /TAXON_ID=2866 /ORGANISM="Crypthecodinium cohnii, Strain Seligo" /LENGTH=234 /DNA_ID=CAMNT_0054013027 /DNA_START=129 /DNA_END=833 /DNA_ORIENTATION=+